LLMDRGKMINLYRESAKQKQESPVVAMFVYGSIRSEQSLYRT
jgi:hypothetical protein